MNKKIALVSFYDLNSFGVRTLHACLKKENIVVDSLFIRPRGSELVNCK